MEVRGHFTPREGSGRTHEIGGRVDPVACLDAVAKRKMSLPPTRV